MADRPGYITSGGTRWELVTSLIGSGIESIVDVGCRDRALSTHVAPGINYVGVDLGPPADVIADAEKRLPFPDRSFDVVVFADVLEHLDDPHSALDEGMRIAKRRVVVVLPNLYSWLHRLQYLAGRTSGKYGLPPENVKDRHRWLLGWSEAEAFVLARAGRNGWEVTCSVAHDGGFRRRSVRLVTRALRLISTPDLWAWQYAAVIEPVAAEQSGATSGPGGDRLLVDGDGLLGHLPG